MALLTACFAQPVRLDLSQPCPAPIKGGWIPNFGTGDMVAVCNRTYVDPATTAEERERIKSYYPRALTVVSRALDGLQGERPAAIFCKTDACRKYFAGSPARSCAFGRRRHPGAYAGGREPTVVIVRIDAPAQDHLTHELVHVEVEARLRSRFRGRLPAWFHEGLATSIANEPGNCQAGEKGLLDLRKLDADRDWMDYTNLPGMGHPTYCQARAEVTTWLERNGREHLFQLLEYVRAGGRFYDAYGPMLTQ
jgi:hypothetical protein